MDADTQIKTAKEQGVEAKRDISRAKEVIESAREALKVRKASH